MSALTKNFKQPLGDLLGKGHRKFGLVEPRKPYLDDDDGSGDGELRMEGHPLLSRLPIGAPSELAAVIDKIPPDMRAEMMDRLDEMNPELKKQLSQSKEKDLAYQKAPPKPSPI